MPHILRNPHSVLAALETRPNDVMEVIVPPKASTDAWERVAQMARARKVKVSEASASRDRVPKGMQSEGSSRMGMAEAIVREKTPIPVEQLFSEAPNRAQGKGLWLALDTLQDPHNVGAIFRAAAFFNVQGILLTQERSSPLTATVYDIASGGVEYVPFATPTNLQRAFELAKDAGLWILGSSEHAQDDAFAVQRDRPWLLVLGNEEKGMRRLTEESCDVLCRIPGQGKVTSLNVSVAAGILISHLTVVGA
jgi:23S rRNA (guanosine2251-2'-O)-methyltransferase